GGAQLGWRKTEPRGGKEGRSRDSSAQSLRQFIEQPVQILVALAALINLLDGVQHRGVVLAAKLASYLGQRGLGKLLGQVHGDLPWVNDGAGVVLGLDFHQLEAELLGHRLLNGFDGDLAGLRINKVFEHLLGIGQGDLGADEGRVGNQANERAFQLAHVGANVGGDVESDVGGKSDPLLLRLFLQDGYLGLQIGRLDIGNQAPLEAAAQAVLNLGQFLGRPVAGDHDLLHGLVQRVEGVEELLLGALLLGQELDIVNEQDIHVAKLVAEDGRLVVAQRIDHLVGELLARQVADGHLRLAALDLMPDGLHEMSLAHADSAIEEERVIGLGGPLGHGQRGGVSKLVAGADYESIEGVARVKLSGSVP